MDHTTVAWKDLTTSLIQAIDNTTIVVPVAPSRRSLSTINVVLLTLVYLAGIIGNLAALTCLFFQDKRRNRKHLLMLRCLATNELIALLGMMVQMYLSTYIPGITLSRGFCAVRILWRHLGLFSGCVALVMAAERWLALTRPFLYQKVTYPIIVRCLFALWWAAFILSILPFLGFGLYYNDKQCIRYREATESKDIAYAYVWFFFGSLLCLSIVCCNLAVSRALSRLSRRSGIIRRISRASSRAKPLLTVAGPPPEVVATAEERAFARLMALLSISFLLCWMPQMIGVPLAQYKQSLPETAVVGKKLISVFHRIADALLCFHFTLDPYIYVLLRLRPRFPLLKPFCRFCRRSGRSRSSSFTGTSCQPGSSGDLPTTPITEAPSTPNSEEREPKFDAALV